jgi:hypothetical protein
MIPLANLVAGPPADNVFKPLLEEGGALSSTTVAGVVSAGAGRGTVLIFIISALSLWISSSYAFANPRVRNLGMRSRTSRMKLREGWMRMINSP